MSDQSHFLVPYALVERLLDTQQDMLDRMQEMIGQIHYHQILANSPQAAAAPPMVSDSIYTSEDEADVRHMEEAGLITPDELKDALREMNFLNSEVDIAM